MLFHALRSWYIDPGRPPAAAGGLRSQYPDLVLGAQQPLDCRQLWQAGRRVSTRSFDTRSKVSIDLAALAIKLAVGASPDDQLHRHGAFSVRGRFSHCTVRPHSVASGFVYARFLSTIGPGPAPHSDR